MGGLGAAGQRLHRQLCALRGPRPDALAAGAAGLEHPAAVAPMAEVEPEHAVAAAAAQYQRSGYTILRNA